MKKVSKTEAALLKSGYNGVGPIYQIKSNQIKFICQQDDI